MDIKMTLSVIDTLEKGWYEPPFSYDQKRDRFVYASFSHSAMEEIKLYLKQYIEIDPIESIENFRHLMDSFCCRAGNDAIKNMFSIYYDVATHVLDVLLGMKSKEKGWV